MLHVSTIFLVGVIRYERGLGVHAIQHNAIKCVYDKHSWLAVQLIDIPLRLEFLYSKTSRNKEDH